MSTVDPLEHQTDRNLALELVRVTEAAALAASKLMGRGDET
jgi:fructose-1,6-bisphosphatase II / sedoheptulose-1,7-bisphosphatase